MAAPLVKNGQPIKTSQQVLRSIERINMKNRTQRRLGTSLTALFALVACAGLIRVAQAQAPDLQQRIAEIKAEAANNHKALMSYNWTEQVTISLKGEVKKVQNNLVRLGTDGKPVKASMDAPPAPPSGGRLKQKIVANKKGELEDYAESMKALAQQYAPPDGSRLQLAYAAGNVLTGPVAGSPNSVQLVVKNYVKPGDQMTIVFDKAEKMVTSLEIATYLDNQKDAMTVAVKFARLPDGPSHVDSILMNGSGKQLNVATQNLSYRKN
jgi:hypothetical protein